MLRRAATAAAALDPGDDLGDDDYLLGTVTADDGENGVPVDVVGEKGAEGDAEGRGEKRKLSVKEKIKMKKHKSRAGGEVYEKEVISRASFLSSLCLSLSLPQLLPGSCDPDA